MRIIIYGAGAIGGALGGHLALAGQEVILIGRPAHVKAIQEHGLRLITPGGTHILQLPAVTVPDQIDFRPDDVVFLCMKGQNTEEALRSLREVIDNIPIFCFQNGVRNEEVAARYFPRVYAVMMRLGSVYLNEGEVSVRRDPPGSLVMGSYPAGTDELVEAVAAKLRAAGLLVKVAADTMPYKWGKLVFNMVNIVGAITDEGGSNIELITTALRQEAQGILAEAGIRWVSQETLSLEWPEGASKPRSVLPGKVRSSTWQSLARRQGGTESDFINGEIVRLAKKIGRQAPINAMLLHILQEMAANREPPGKYTPAQLRLLLGLEHTSRQHKSNDGKSKADS
ncbi:MAG: 2-dehydropantoate 2-reductase [Chloroflexi bacterium]|nr:2-dehydropantoate 2-reductase [Chloroflexota bacterium]